MRMGWRRAIAARMRVTALASRPQGNSSYSTYSWIVAQSDWMAVEIGIPPNWRPGCWYIKFLHMYLTSTTMLYH
jgi:hypothetical protein